MLPKLACVSFVFTLQFCALSFSHAEEAPTSKIPIQERAFVKAINGFDKNKIIAQFGQPAKADDVRIKDTNKIVASIWQYHYINQAEDGSFFETTELDFIDDKVVSVVFLNNNGEDTSNDSAIKYELMPNTPAPETR